MYECESWTIKKAENWRTDAFELWCWRRLLRIPWAARKSKQSTLKEINSECSLEGLMLKLKLQYFGHLMQRADSLEKTLMPGKIEYRRKRGQQRWNGWMASLTQWTWVWASSGRGWRTRKTGMLQFMGLQRVRHDWATEQQPLSSSGNQNLLNTIYISKSSSITRKHSKNLKQCYTLFTQGQEASSINVSFNVSNFPNDHMLLKVKKIIFI